MLLYHCQETLWTGGKVITQYPVLAKLAKLYLCVPGSSVSAECGFSTAGDVVTAQRSNLTSEHVDQLLFLHNNLIIPKHKGYMHSLHAKNS